MAYVPGKPMAYYDSVREDMLKYIPPDAKTTLELGCGFGRFSALVKERLKTESWAVEINEAAAREAAKSLDRVIRADALESLSQLPDGYFDCIILFDILEHLIDPYGLLSALKAKLTAHGVVAASIPNIRYYRFLVGFLVHGDWQYRDQGVTDRTHLRFFTCKSIRRMFEESGFRLLTMEGIHPTSSRTYRLLNLVLLNTLSDVRYKHFAVVAAQEPRD